MDRQSGDLSSEIPQRNVDGADAAQRRISVARPHLLIEPFPIERILSHEKRLEKSDERRGVEIRAATRRTEKRMAFHAIVGLHGHQSKLAAAGRHPAGMFAELARREIVPREQRDSEV